ncbi:MAG: hypothetical protein JWO53_537, partial [Chlamydiia bacterium]|nr:hypothetical protein [Chlamydiia bacterium]
TRLIHSTPHTIPLYENMLFCLALFRTKTHESIQEAKVVLDRLLYFQGDGNFPVHLHDYPHCHDHYLGAKILCPLFWIKKDFSQVLGDALLERLEKAYTKLTQFLNSLNERLEMPTWVQLKIGASKQLPTIGYEEMNPQLLGEMLSAMQMYGLESEEIWQFLAATWHPVCKSYIGPAVRVMQAGYEPACTLYDYYMGYYYGSLSQRAAKPQIAALQAALIQPQTLTLSEVQDMETNQALVHKTSNWGVSLNKVRNGVHPGYYPLYFVTDTHTFVFDLPKGRIVDASWSETKGEIICELSEEVYSDNIEKAIACSFFVDARDGIAFEIQNTTATSFSLVDEVKITIGALVMSLTFSLLDGDGMFLGHINKANRPSQISNKGKDRYQAFDWQLFLRAVRGTTKCRLKISLSL